MRAKQPSLFESSVGQVVAAQAPRKTKIVANQRAGSSLSARNSWLQHQCAESFGGGIDRCGEARRPGSDDRDVARGDMWTCWQAELGHDIRIRRLDEVRAIEVDNHGQARTV